MTEHALNHRFRRLRAQVVIVREARKMGLDMKHMNEEGQLPAKQESVQKNSTLTHTHTHTHTHSFTHITLLDLLGPSIIDS